MPATPKPSHLAIRMYQMGFGDCLLLSFTYPAPLSDGRSERHVLIDFGSSHGPARGKLDMKEIARSISDRCGGKLDAVIVSHRHKDHLSGFGNDAAWNVLKDLSPSLVVRPWTEDPDADDGDDAIRALREGEEFARRLMELPLPHAVGADALRQLALDQVKNKEAIDRLDEWAGGKGEYLSYGKRTRLNKLLPGVKVHVLGPPTPKEWAEVAEEEAKEDPEYWLHQRRRWLYRQRELSGLRADALGEAAADGVADAPEAADTETSSDGRPQYGPVAWLIERMKHQRVAWLHRIIRSLDDLLNNTSLILLFEVAGRSLLFSGDAQVENWRYALEGAPEKAKNRQLLRKIDVYKVGHHGSRNATPRTLYQLWTEDPAGAEASGHQMIALLSTKPGVHGEPPRSEVPRRPLLTALRSRATLYSTTTLRSPYLELEADLTTDEPFRKVS